MHALQSREEIAASIDQNASAASNSWAGIDKLSIHFSDNPGTSGGQLYRNGKNQVGVTVQTRAVDSRRNWIIPDQDLLQRIFSALWLVNGENLAQFSWNNGQQNNWCFSDVRNAFLTTPSGGAAVVREQHSLSATVGDDGTIYFQFYVTCPYQVTLASISIAAQIKGVPDGHGGSQNMDCAGKTSGITASTVSITSHEPPNFSPSELQYFPTRTIVNGDAPSNHKDSKNWLFEYQWSAPPAFPIHSAEWVSGENWTYYTNFQCGNPKSGYLWMAGGRIHLPGTTYNGNTQSYLLSNYWYSGSVDRPFSVTTANNAIKLTRFITGNYSYIDGDAGNFNRTGDHQVKVTDIYGTVRWLTIRAFTTADEGNRPPITSAIDTHG
ncbi:hypothetical protein [Pseudomonas sp. Irchel 3E13]|uniref:hypothetical protein n=1 Tax=Pseudomonas sp. Irchel 3E13 TaxID=2008975 RepID=UPI000BA4A0AB|nr:hypothetical protein [Pseudomonas sp. Irchel 3E13]